VPDPSVDSIPRDRTLAQQLSGTFIVFGALVGVGFLIVSLTYVGSTAWLTPESERSRLAVRAESAAYSAMLDAENGLRAYHLARDKRFIGPYVHGEAALARANEALAAYVGAGSEVAVRMVATRLAEERWHQRWATAAADVTVDQPLDAASMLEGKTLFDEYRVVQAAFASALDARSARLSLREQHVIAGQVAVVLAVFLTIFLLAVRQHRALRDSIVAPVASLLHHIGRVRDGQLEATVPAGPRELRHLGEGLNDMVTALATARQVAASRDDALREHASRLHQILEASREFSESLNLRYVVGAVRDSTAAIGGYERVLVWLMEDTQKRLVNSEDDLADVLPEVPVEMGHGIAGRAAKSGRITFESQAGQVRFRDSNAEPVHAIAIPLIVGARVVGALEARHATPQVATREKVELLEMLATHAATAIESARLHEVIEARSQMDVLTRLFNRRRLEEDLDTECRRSARYGRPLAFVMLDVDHFKAFNDTHGHPHADAALQEVARVILAGVRTTDTAYRYGGEEFCILMRETLADDAMNFAERVRRRIEERFTSGEFRGITASFGVAGFSPESPTPRALVEAADAALYESKHAGRNRVALSSGPRPPALVVIRDDDPVKPVASSG
jgi:diguanylate cyclase (GGDEF)-like protein